MANWFNDLTKTLAHEKLTRRQAIRRSTAILVGAVAAASFPWADTVFASPEMIWDVKITNGMFVPAVLQGVKVGDIIIIKNDDKVPHTITFPDGKTKVTLNPGQKVKIKIKGTRKFGTYTLENGNTLEVEM